MEDKEYIQQLRQTYRELNRSFKPVLIFHVGESAGFFSESKDLNENKNED